MISNDEALGNWFDILINAKWSKKEDGFFKIWVNGDLRYDYEGPTKSKSKVYQKFGVYRTGITRYLNYANLDMMKKCFSEKGKTPEEHVGFRRFQKKKFPGHKTSIKIYLTRPIKVLINKNSTDAPGPMWLLTEGGISCAYHGNMEPWCHGAMAP